VKNVYRLISSAVFIVVAIALASFCANNDQSVVLDFYPLPGELSAPAYLLVIVPFIIGALFAALVLLPGRLHLGQQAGRATREAEALERELDLVRRELKAAEKKLAGDEPAKAALPAPTGRRRVPAGFGSGAMLLGAEWGGGINGKKTRSSSAPADM